MALWDPMHLLALAWFILGGCWYVYSFFGYNYNWKFFTDNADTFNPMLARTKYSKNVNLLIMAASAVVGFAGAVGLWFGWIWAIILAVIVHGNEAYRGATYYMKEGLYWESIKHMLIHAFMVGFILAWVVYAKYVVCLGLASGVAK